MLPGNIWYTLVGFSTELDWRPLHFVAPIPHYRVCSACGLVRKTTALLPCMHILCGACYEQCEQGTAIVCPIDGHRCLDQDVDCKECPTDDLLRREVKCWNEGSGCGAVVAAADVVGHFQRECRHHSTRCPKCSAAVLCSDVCAHLRSDCTNTGPPLSKEQDALSSCEDETMSLAYPIGALQEEESERRAPKRPLLIDSGGQTDRTNGCLHNIDSLKETITQELSRSIHIIKDAVKEGRIQASRENQDNVSRIVRECMAVHERVQESTVSRAGPISALSYSLNKLDEAPKTHLDNATSQSSDNQTQIITLISAIREETKETGQTLLDRINKLLVLVELSVVRCEFFVKGVQSLRDAAMREGWTQYESDQVYLRGYRMTPGIRLRRNGESLKLHARLRLHKGDFDNVIQWPFEQKIKLSIVHPRDGAERQLCVKPPRSFALEKPPESGEYGCWFPGASLILADLIREKYVFDNQLRIKWEVFP